MIKNSKENGNNVFSFGPKNNEESHIAVLPLCWDDLEPVLKLLSIPGGDRKEKLRLQTVENLPELQSVFSVVQQGCGACFYVGLYYQEVDV